MLAAIRGMKRKRGVPDSGESDQDDEESEAQSESLEVTGSEEESTDEEGVNKSGSEGEEESEEEDPVRCERRKSNLPAHGNIQSPIFLTHCKLFFENHINFRNA